MHLTPSDTCAHGFWRTHWHAHWHTHTHTQVRPINFTDLEEAMKGIRASVSADSLKAYEDWMKEYGVKG